MKYLITEQELPPPMRRYLADVDTGRAYYAKSLHPSRHALSSAFRGLIETARHHGYAEKLSRETGVAFFDRLRADGWQENSLSSQAGLLRKYAFETEEGMEWAIESGAFDRRPLELVFRAPHWSRFLAIQSELQEVCEPSLIRLADRWMRWRQSMLRLDDATMQSFKADARNLGLLAELMSEIDPENPDTIFLQQCQRIRRTVTRPKSPSHKKPSFHDLPEPFYSEMARIAARSDKPNGLSSARIELLSCALRRLVRITNSRQMPVELSMETAKAFAEDVFDSDIKTRSKANYCDALAGFAKHANYPSEIREALMETHNALKLESSSDLRRKEVALAQNPLNLVDLAEIAHARLRQAPHQDHIRTRRRDYALAGAMALLAKLPLRSLDLRTGRIGKEFHRDSEGWSVEIETSKTGTFINGRLADCLIPYLDATLLMGVGEMHLWTVYEARVGTALFGNPARGWKPFGDNWLWENMRRLTGHGPHIARSLTYDAVVEDPDLDLRVAQALCGHAQETSRHFYELNADRYRRLEAQDILAEIAESRPNKKAFGAFVENALLQLDRECKTQTIQT